MKHIPRKHLFTGVIIALFTMLGCAWGVGNSYDNGGNLTLSAIVNNGLYKPNTAGTNTLNITGALGSAATPDAKNFKIYGAQGNEAGDSNLSINWGTSKLYTNGIVQFLGGGQNSALGNSTLNFNSEAGSELYASNGSGQKTLLLAGGPEGGTVRGNTLLNISGSLGATNDVYYVKAAAAGLINNDSAASSIVVEGDSRVLFNADWKVGGGTALLAGPMIQKTGAASGIVKGTASIVVDGKGAVREMWAAGALLNLGAPTLSVKSTNIELKNGLVDDSVFAGAEVWTKGTATVLGDTNITVSNAEMGQNNGRARLWGGHDIEVEGGKGYVNGSTNITVTGGKNIKYIFGGGMSWNGKTAATESIVKGNSNITLLGNNGLAALSPDAMIFAGGRKGNESAALATVQGDAFITFKDINDAAFKGHLSGQGTNGDYKIDGYTDSVLGDSNLVFDNVSADFSQAEIKNFDVITLTPGTQVKLGKIELTPGLTIKLTGDWAGRGTVTVLTASTEGEIFSRDETSATGITASKVSYDEATHTYTLVLSCPSVTKEAPVKPTLPIGTPEGITAAKPGLAYIDPADEKEKEETVNMLLSAIKPGTLTSADLTVNEETQLLQASPSTAKSAAEQALKDKGLTAPVTAVRPLPIFTITSEDVTTAGTVVAVAFDLKGSEFKAESPELLQIVKIISSSSGKFFKYAAKASDFGDGAFTVQDASDNIFTGKFEADRTYRLVLFIKDNGDFDLMSEERAILDPAAMIATEAPKPSGSSGSSSSSGCNTGFGALALAAIALLPALRGKKR
ncbi:MAG: Synerg-CTERM sorting domain-containing protein [Cloacibacillus sp.]